MGLRELSNLPCLFTDDYLTVVCIVDDFWVFAKHYCYSNSVRQSLQKDFTSCYLWDPTHLLTMQIDWINDSFASIRHERMIYKLSAQHAIIKANLLRIPIQGNLVISMKRHRLNRPTISKYWRIAGTTMYPPSKTRTDSCTAVSNLGSPVTKSATDQMMLAL